MPNGIGSTLRDARTRRKLGLEDVEGATKIRLRYLRAMENEEWDVLPGGAYSRAFLRTYASYLGLDGDRIAEDYRSAEEAEGGHRPSVIEAVPRVRSASRDHRMSGRVLAALACVALVGAVVAVGLISGNGGGSDGSKGAANSQKDAQKPSQAAAERSVSLQLVAAGEVWVCLLDAAGEPVIDGAILQAGEEEGPFRSPEFAVAFGNGEISMVVNGREADLPPSSSPVGYEVTRSADLRPIPEGERPECA